MELEAKFLNPKNTPSTHVDQEIRGGRVLI